MPDKNLKEKMSGLPFLQNLDTPPISMVKSIDNDPTILGQYNNYNNQAEIAKKAAENPRLFKDVLLHEMGHAFQNQTLGMGDVDPVDTAIRNRLGLPMKDADISHSLQENFANYVGNNQATEEPLTHMVMRSMANRAFNARR